MAMSEKAGHFGYAPTQESQLYPETDGKPMAASDDHRRVLMRVLRILEAFFAQSPDVYVSGDLMMYYVQGDPESRLSRCPGLSESVRRRAGRIASGRRENPQIS